MKKIKSLFEEIGDLFLFNKYETDNYLQNYIKGQYGFFNEKKPYKLSEPFYSKLIEESKPFINQNSSVLDIGCATGRLAFEFEKMGAKKISWDRHKRKFYKFLQSCKNRISRN